MAELSAGADIDSYCGKCKLFLAHVIIAMKAGAPARIQCKTCGASHAYRQYPPGTKPPAATRSYKGPTPAKTRRKPTEWEVKVKQRDSSEATDYSIAHTFNHDELLRHKKFGVGLVVGFADTNKIHVLFESGIKLLMHAKVSTVKC